MRCRKVGLAICAAYIGALGLATAQFAWSQTAPRAETPLAYAKGNKQKIAAYVVLLRLRHDLFLRWKETGKWPDDKEANAALAAHGEYWAKQLAEGRAILAGGMDGDYWDNVAMIVFEAESEEQAQKIVKADPAVKAYVFQAQVRPFGVSFITNKYGRKE
ncbi:MAG: hypothetical protein HY255_11035 [Betaproteobacteria bacterium]|nr:hypothetical protein [Betaproteobacteria bacterium]